MPRPSKAAANGSFANEGQGQSHPVGGPTVNGVAPSLLDTKFAFALVTQLRSKPDVDWDQIGSIMGISKKSAGERWRLMRIKFGIIMNDEAAVEDPGSVRKRKTRAADANAAKNGNHEGDDGDDGDDDQADDNRNVKQSATAATPATPAKRSRKPASAGKKAPTIMPKSGKKRGASTAGPATAAAGTFGTVMNQGAEGGDSDDMAAASSPMKKVRSSKEVPATIAVACDMPSPLSSLPGMTADEGSGTEIGV
ncbi:hypothetical protein P885DRAFT_81161 [Corynascus similis CBS 632.67]